nr:FAD-dependent oxidoreductase [Chloroflexota bacterium]
MTAAPSPLRSPSEDASALPGSAQAVVVGGGIVGCSIAYHLVRRGWRDVLLLEQNVLGGGTTWHAAGMVARFRADRTHAWICDRSARLYAELEEEGDQPTGWQQVGSLYLARTAERMTLFRRTAAMARSFGIEVDELSPMEARARWPLIRADDLVGGVWLPDDGKVRPRETALALANAARRLGATILEHVQVVDLQRSGDRVTGVITDRGLVTAERVVLATGMWSRQLARRSGVNVPLYPVEHHYVVSGPVEGARDDLPCARDPDGAIYFRTENDRIVLGAFQARSKPWDAQPVPGDFSLQLLEPDWKRFAAPLAEGRRRIPALQASTLERFVNGPESFTPDNNPLLGEAPELDGLWIAAGFNSAGIAYAGGAGELLASWMTEGIEPFDVWTLDLRRFGPTHANPAFLRQRSSEVLGLHYRMAWPDLELETGRNLRLSPVHDRLAAAGARFGQRMGLERPNWFDPSGRHAGLAYSFERPGWFEPVRSEHIATRSAVALFDQTSFGKAELVGADAARILQRLCGADIDVPVGQIVYTGLFNERGTFESDVSVVRLASDRFYVVTGSTQAVRDAHWIGRHIASEDRASWVDVSSAHAVLGVMGPRAGDLLQALTEADLSDTAFPRRTAQAIDVGSATALALRISYVGELGWELHVSPDQAGPLYDALVDAGRPLGLLNAGHYAI